MEMELAESPSCRVRGGRDGHVHLSLERVVHVLSGQDISEEFSSVVHFGQTDKWTKFSELSNPDKRHF